MTARRRIWSPFPLPNILTSLNLLAGFYAIIQSIHGDYSKAVWAIILAGVLDGLDGMAARLTHQSSAFGLEFDSMADLVSFGVAPALLAYLWVLQPFGRIGWVAAFLYLACTVLRLARFNVQADDVQKFSFLGLPTPAAAGYMAALYLFLTYLEVGPRTVGVIVIIACYLIAFLMVSNITYLSLKAIRVKKHHSFYIPVLFILILAIILIRPQIFLWVLGSLYLLSGPVVSLYHRAAELRHRRSKDAGAIVGSSEEPEKGNHG